MTYQFSVSISYVCALSLCFVVVSPPPSSKITRVFRSIINTVQYNTTSSAIIIYLKKKRKRSTKSMAISDIGLSFGIHRI